MVATTRLVNVSLLLVLVLTSIFGNIAPLTAASGNEIPVGDGVTCSSFSFNEGFVSETLVNAWPTVYRYVAGTYIGAVSMPTTILNRQVTWKGNNLLVGKGKGLCLQFTPKNTIK